MSGWCIDDGKGGNMKLVLTRKRTGPDGYRQPWTPIFGVQLCRPVHAVFFGFNQSDQNLFLAELDVWLGRTSEKKH
jgi:hypothetical protein